MDDGDGPLALRCVVGHLEAEGTLGGGEGGVLRVDRVKHDYIRELFDQQGETTVKSRDYQLWIEKNHEWLEPYAKGSALVCFIQYHLHLQLVLLNYLGMLLKMQKRIKKLPSLVTGCQIRSVMA